MRLLTLKTIAILMIIAIGFMVTESFVEKQVEADCGFYPTSLCISLALDCIFETEWADFNCPGANDAGVDQCNELTEEAEATCNLAASICYHAD